MKCGASGNPAPVVQWSKERSAIPMGAWHGIKPYIYCNLKEWGVVNMLGLIGFFKYGKYGVFSLYCFFIFVNAENGKTQTAFYVQSKTKY